MCIYVTELFCYAPETNSTLKSIILQLKKEKHQSKNKKTKKRRRKRENSPPSSSFGSKVHSLSACIFVCILNTTPRVFSCT